MQATSKSLQPALASVIRLLRLKKGWSQEELALTVGMKTTEISHLESGRRNPRLETMERLAGAFGIRFSEMGELAEDLNSRVERLERKSSAR